MNELSKTPRDEMSEATVADTIDKTNKSTINKFFTESKTANGLDNLNKNIIRTSAGALRAWNEVGIPGSGNLSDGLKKASGSVLGKKLSTKSVSADMLDKIAEGKSIKESTKEVYGEYKNAGEDVIQQAGAITSELKEKANNIPTLLGENMQDISGRDFTETDLIIAQSQSNSCKPHILDAKKEIIMQRREEHQMGDKRSEPYVQSNEPNRSKGQ